MAGEIEQPDSSASRFIPTTSLASGGLLHRPRLEEYAEKYRETFVFERTGGVLLVRLTTDGGPFGRSGWFEIWSQAWLDIGNDPENEVIVITGMGDRWINMVDQLEPDGAWVTDEILRQRSQPRPPRGAYNTYFNALKNTENLIFGINVPTIGAINGPAAVHYEFALLCDIALCTEDTILRDPHCQWGIAPGDGVGMAFQELMGPRRSAYYLYTGDPIPAAKALEYGLVNEVLPRDRLIPRAMEIARQIQQMPTLGRLMARQIIRRRFQQRHVSDAGFHIAHELVGILADQPAGGALNPEQRRRAAERWEAATRSAGQSTF